MATDVVNPDVAFTRNFPETLFPPDEIGLKDIKDSVDVVYANWTVSSNLIVSEVSETSHRAATTLLCSKR